MHCALYTESAILKLDSASALMVGEVATDLARRESEGIVGLVIVWRLEISSNSYRFEALYQAETM